MRKKFWAFIKYIILDYPPQYYFGTENKEE